MKTVMNFLLILVILAGGIYGFYMYQELSKTDEQPITISNDTEKNTNTTKNDELPTELDSIVVTSPRPHEIVKSPLVITGEATGTWFFEGDFPVMLMDLEGTIIEASYVKAEGEWMTEEFVPFVGELDYSAEKETKAVLVFKQDDPSGLGMKDEFLEIPIVLSPAEMVVEEEKIDVEEHSNVSVTTPVANDIITSPFNISGEAMGTFYYEGSFSFRIVNEEGNMIVQHYVMATEDFEWGEERMIPFEGTAEFETPDREGGYVIIEKPCPSGLCSREEIDVLKVPVLFEMISQ